MGVSGMILSSMAQILLDSLLLFLCIEIFFRENRAWKYRDMLLIPVLLLGLCVTRLNTSVGVHEISFEFTQNAYAVFPVDNIVFLGFFVLLMIVMSSLWFKQDNSYTVFAVLASFSVYIILRQGCILLFYLCGLHTDMWYIYISRILSLIVCLLLLYTPFLIEWIKESIKVGSMMVRLLVANTAVLLFAQMSLLEFDIQRMLEQAWLSACLLLLLLFANSVFMFLAARKMKEQERIAMIEQYIPAIEELISQVRARQHEYNNRLLAISSAVATAETLVQAQDSVKDLIQEIPPKRQDIALLNCGSNVIGGMLYSKIRQAEMRHLTVQFEISAKFQKGLLQESDWVEIVGILLDNATEAASEGDILYFSTRMDNGKMQVLVSNPRAPFSNVEFMQLFRRGYSTKLAEPYPRGHGLANILQVVDRHHGKIITRNEILHGKKSEYPCFAPSFY